MSHTPRDAPYSDFDNWKEYPTNLNLESDCFHIDVAELRERLSLDSERLFVEDSESELQCLALSAVAPCTNDPVPHLFAFADYRRLAAQVVNEEHFTSAERLDLELARISPRRDLRVFYITQAFSWSRLLISEDHCLKLFTYLKVHPSFLDILHTSGEKIAPVEESFASQFSRIHRPVCSGRTGMDAKVALMRGYELGYGIKYVEKHGRKLADPYSLRETGVYQKWDSTSDRGDWIVMQPSESIKKCLERILPQTESDESAYLFRLHAAILLKASGNWRFYINYLEDSFSKIVDRGFYTNIRGPSHEGDIDADFSDVRKLQILTDKLRRLSHVLQLNMEVATSIQDFAQRLRGAWSSAILEDKSSIFDEFESNINLFLSQHRIHKSRIDSMLDRSNGISTLVRTIIDLRSTESNNHIVESIRDLTLQSVLENKKLERLSVNSAQDTRSMMVIALITTIFLPASFVATFFGSNFFGFTTSDEHGNELKVASNFWIYVVVTITLLMITVGGGWVCWMRSRKAKRADLEKEGADSIELERREGDGG